MDATQDKVNRAVLLALQRIEARLERIESRLERIESLLEGDVDEALPVDLDGAPSGSARDPSQPL